MRPRASWTALSNRCGATCARAGCRGVASASSGSSKRKRWPTGARSAVRRGVLARPWQPNEATIMKTDKTKKRDRLIDEELLREIDEIAERIREEAGEIDVVELIRQDREEH